MKADAVSLDGRRYTDWPRRAPFHCGTCGAVSSFRCYHERPLAKGDRVRVQPPGAAFTGIVRGIELTEFGGLADVEPDGLGAALVTVSFGPDDRAERISPLRAAA